MPATRGRRLASGGHAKDIRHSSLTIDHHHQLPFKRRHWHLIINDYTTLYFMMAVTTTLTSTAVVGTLTCINHGPITSIYIPQTSCYSTTSLVGANFNIFAEPDCMHMALWSTLLTLSFSRTILLVYAQADITQLAQFQIS
jgi:hypothetical protein